MTKVVTQENAIAGLAKKYLPYLLIIFGLFFGCFTIWGIWRAAFPGMPTLQGQMEGRVISVSSKVPGRVLEVLVEEGQHVENNQPVVKMHLPEMEALLTQVRYQESAAQAAQSLVDEGARPQEKAAAQAEWERARAAAELAAKTYGRIASLFKQGLVARQRYDEARAEMLVTANQEKAARQAYDIAVIGAREQEKKVAQDKTGEAVAGVSAAAALAEDIILFAPHSGEVDKVVLVAGEMVAAGFPVLTLVNLEDQWATFNSREDYMRDIRMGGILKAKVPAVSGNELEFRIYYISPRANYATWRSTRENSGYDMKTFEVRAWPVHQVQGLRPGMSVLVER